MQNLQHKIDRLIQNANEEFSKQSNVVGALVDYSRAQELYAYLDKWDKIQLHEIYVRISICWDILGNYQLALDCLTKALDLVPNISNLLIYKSALEECLNMTKESNKDLAKYRSLLIGKSDLSLYHIFRIVYYYTNGNYDKKAIIKDINEYFDKYKKCTVLLFLRAKIYYDIAKELKKENPKGKEYQDYLKKYESDLTNSNEIESNDTACLIRDGIKKNNITKLFFMILPEMDYYQPSPLVNYSRFQSGFKLFYVLFKIAKLFRIKVKRRKIKNYHLQKIKNAKMGLGPGTNLNQNSKITINTNTSILSESSVNKSKGKSKSPVPSSDRIKMKKVENEIKLIKKSYEEKIKKLYSSVFVKSKNCYDRIEKYDLELDFSLNYFIRKKYYAPFNISSTILEAEEPNLKESNDLGGENQISEFGQILNDNNKKEPFSELSVSAINIKKENAGDVSVNNDIKLLEVKKVDQKKTLALKHKKSVNSMKTLNKEQTMKISKISNVFNIGKPKEKDKNTQKINLYYKILKKNN